MVALNLLLIDYFKRIVWQMDWKLMSTFYIYK